MLDEAAVKSVLRRSAEGKWAYPNIFNALKNAGVERYETNVLTHEIKYVGDGSSFVETAPPGFKPLQGGAEFNVSALKLAIARSQAREITYAEFLAEIAAAGVPFYRVDMGPRTVTYHGANREKHVEKVPLPEKTKPAE